MNNKKLTIPTPENERSISDNIIAFWELIATLRERSAWDKVQTHKTIAPLIIEEVYEMIDAINENDDENLKKELGDVLLHIFMHSYFAEERGAFSLIDVISGIHKKLISRLPSVFTDTPIENEIELMKDWEKIKIKDAKKSVIEGIPKTIPSLLRAQRIQEKVARVGFDWNNKNDVWDKVFEEIVEFKETRELSQEKKEEEFGDLLFSLVNASRHEGISAENAMLGAIQKFERRFRYIEENLNSKNENISDKSLEELDTIWDEAKAKGL